MFKLLLDNGADVEAKNDHYTVLFYALSNHFFEATKLLIDKGANFQTVFYNGATPINFAAKLNEDKELILLIQEGADFNVQDKLTKRTPLMNVVARCFNEQSIQIVKHLLENNADITIRDKKGLNAMEIAEKECHFKPKQELLLLLRAHAHSLEGKNEK